MYPIYRSSVAEPHGGYVTNRGLRPTLARTIANFALNGKEETSPLAGRQFPWNGVFGVGSEILKRRENANYPYALFTGYDCDPCSIRIESSACQRRPDDFFLRAGKQSNLAPR